MNEDSQPGAEPAVVAPPRRAATATAVAVAVPRWLAYGAAVAWRLLAIAAAIGVTVVRCWHTCASSCVPVIVALLLSTVLCPPARWLTRHRFSGAAAAGTVMIVAVAVLAIAVGDGRRRRRPAVRRPRHQRQGRASARPARRSSKPPFNLSKVRHPGEASTSTSMSLLSDSSGSLTDGAAAHGAMRGRRAASPASSSRCCCCSSSSRMDPGLWRWVVDTFGGRQPTPPGRASRAAAYSAFVGLRARTRARRRRRRDDDRDGACAILGVPLDRAAHAADVPRRVRPARRRVQRGPRRSAHRARQRGHRSRRSSCSALVIAVQQVEGHILYPIIMGRTVKVHPIAVILALADRRHPRGHHRRSSSRCRSSPSPRRRSATPASRPRNRSPQTEDRRRAPQRSFASTCSAGPRPAPPAHEYAPRAARYSAPRQ